MGYILGYIPGMQLHARKSERDVNTAYFLLSLQKNENGNVVTFSWKSN